MIICLPLFPATPGGAPYRNRPSSKMTKYVESWGADKPFANITDSIMAKNIGLAVSWFSKYIHIPKDNRTAHPSQLVSRVLQ